MTLYKNTKNENVAIKQTWLDEIEWFLCPFKLIWWSLSFMQTWPTRKNNPSYLLHYLLYMDVILIFTLLLWPSYFGTFDTNYISCKNCNFQLYLLKNWRKIIFSLEHSRIFFLDMKFEIFINCYTNMFWNYHCLILIKCIWKILKIFGIY